MRAKEFINEETRTEPGEHHASVSVGVVGPKGMDNLYVSRYYDNYRMAILTGLSSEDLDKTDVASYIGNRPMYVPYSDADHDKTVAVLKKLGQTPEEYMPRGSNEQDDTHVVSPVRQVGPIGVKR
jgi:hypothetical protein